MMSLAKLLGERLHIVQIGFVRAFFGLLLVSPMMLREGLATNDTDLITEAGSLLNQDASDAASARAQMGIRSQRVARQLARLEDQELATQTILSDLRDADFNEVVSRFAQLQEQLQATMLAGQQSLSLSLLDFLR